MIPKTFSLVNRNWLVRRVTTKQLQKHIDTHPHMEGCPSETLLGLCDPKVNRIFINKDLHTSEEEMESTFWHEFVHALKFANGEDEHDEVEVDRLGGFLHQFEGTKKPS